ncbi:hypothetical protein AMECASPLE_035129 [Ameca splendens]|uniref:Uncharacterized protein n=1 Tax=Ameca splendens TaxID=208324 RepID=A0ABV0Z719_9TELE
MLPDDSTRGLSRQKSYTKMVKHYDHLPKAHRCRLEMLCLLPVTDPGRRCFVQSQLNHQPMWRVHCSTLLEPLTQLRDAGSPPPKPPTQAGDFLLMSMYATDPKNVLFCSFPVETSPRDAEFIRSQRNEVQ